MSATAQIVAKYILADNLPAAERVCRLELRRAGGDRDAALFGLAAVARALHRPGHERLCLEAIENPYRDRVVPPDALADLAPAPGNGTLTVEARACGFWSEAFGAVGGVLLARLLGRTPRVRWCEHYLFSDDISSSAFERYFEPLVEGAGDAVEAGEGFEAVMSNAAALRCSASHLVCRHYVSPLEVLYWIIPSLAIGEGEIKNHLAAALHAALRPRGEIVEAVDSYVGATFGSAPYCAFHLRGTDKGVENPDAVLAVQATVDRVDRLERTLPLYLMTDDADLAAAMRHRFGERLRMQPFRRATGPVGLHASSRGEASREQLGQQTLVDTLVAARSTRFIGSGRSNIGAAVDLMMHRTPARLCELVDANHLLEYRHWGTVHW